jgi:hypothetical protein
MREPLPGWKDSPRTAVEPYAPVPGAIDTIRVASPLDWMRGRRVEREFRRAELAHQRLAQRMASLGEQWRVLDLKEATGGERTSFLAVGPGGLYAVTVKDHGRSKVNFAGDVVQIDGASVNIPVMPVLAFAGSGMITFYGMPKGCIVTSYQDLGRILNGRGSRLAPDTVEKLFAVATNPSTWLNPPYVALADRYRWYPDAQQAVSKGDADKRPAPR